MSKLCCPVLEEKVTFSGLVQAVAWPEPCLAAAAILCGSSCQSSGWALLHQPQVMLVSEPDRGCLVHVSRVFALLIKDMNNLLMDFSTDVPFFPLGFLLSSVSLSYCKYLHGLGGVVWVHKQKGSLARVPSSASGTC